MSGFNFEIPDDYMKNLLDNDFEKIATKALEDTAPELKSSMQKSIKSAIHSESTGELENSLKISKAKETKTDSFIITVKPSGMSKNPYYDTRTYTRSYPVSNVLKAIWLNYGDAHQAPSPWINPAINACKEKIMQRMQKIWEEMTKE